MAALTGGDYSEVRGGGVSAIERYDAKRKLIVGTAFRVAETAISCCELVNGINPANAQTAFMSQSWSSESAEAKLEAASPETAEFEAAACFADWLSNARDNTPLVCIDITWHCVAQTCANTVIGSQIKATNTISLRKRCRVCMGV